MNHGIPPVSSLLFAMLALAALPASADSSGTGFYVGGNVGLSRASVDETEINRSLIGLGLSSATTTSDQNGVGFKAYGGYAITPNIAIEAGYFDLGKFTTDSTVTPAGTVHTEFKFKGFNADVVGSLPVGSGFTVFGRVGVISTKEDINVASTGSVVTLVPNSSHTKTGWKAGIGAEYAFASGLGVRAEIENYRVPDGADGTANAGLFSIGLLYHF